MTVCPAMLIPLYEMPFLGMGHPSALTRFAALTRARETSADSSEL
jgi:hypothetical protein